MRLYDKLRKMAVIYRCDGCKKDKSKLELTKLVMFATFGETRDDKNRDIFHLCPECKIRVIESIKK